MVCSGVVRQGKIVLEPGARLPEGSIVRVEVLAESTETRVTTSRQPACAESTPAPTREAWLEDWRRFARKVTASWKSPQWALDILSEMRR